MYLASALNPDSIVQAGILIIALIVFAETGLLLGFFLPGDTLLVAAGVFAAGHHHKVPLWELLPILALASILGYELGYKIGKAAGPRFFKRKDGLFFKEEYVTRTAAFFEKHGGKSILLARFIAVIRTVVPLVAGMSNMNRRFFVFYNIVGGILWTFSVTLAAYWIGSRIPNLDRYILWLLVAAMVGTFAVIFIEALRSRKKRAQLKQALREEWHYFFKR